MVVMQAQRSAQGQSHCPVCRTPLPPGATVCGRCGAPVAAAARAGEDAAGDMTEDVAEELRHVNYLLAELSKWEGRGLVTREQAARLRQDYGRRRAELRAQTAPHAPQSETRSPPAPPANYPSHLVDGEHAPTRTERAPLFSAQDDAQQPAPVVNDFAGSPAPAQTSTVQVAHSASPFSTPARVDHQATADGEGAPRRTLIETLADPQTLRLLLYTGAAMLVVGVIIWLRDVLYLKLQEPIVQAALLAVGTLAATAGGWFVILRTRLRFTGRALTLTGSLLVPVNFWFLVRSGLVAATGRAWMVCALCAALYAATAHALAEKLYVYLACAAGVATLWAASYRIAPEAHGLYALATMAAALIMLHLSQLPARRLHAGARLDEGARDGVNDSGKGAGINEDAEDVARRSYGLWGAPLAHVALGCAAISLIGYMPLRSSPLAPPLYERAFRLLAGGYDGGVAMLLFAAGAYVAWFAGRFVYARGRAWFYVASALALFWTEFLALDGLRVSGANVGATLAATALFVSLAARFTREEVLGRALHTATLLLVIVLASFTVPLAAITQTFTQSFALLCLAGAAAILSAGRLFVWALRALLAHAAAVLASGGFFVALLAIGLPDHTLFAAAAVWPFALYAGAGLIGRRQGEQALAGAFAVVGDVACALLLLTACAVALLLHMEAGAGVASWRTSLFFVLACAVVYGAARAGRERSFYGAGLSATAALVCVAAGVDWLKVAEAYPRGWSAAAWVVCAAFVLRKAGALVWPHDEGPAQAHGGVHDDVGRAHPKDKESNAARARQGAAGGLTPAGVVAWVCDCAAVLCAAVWLATTLLDFGTGVASGASCVVMFLALAYWCERAANARLPQLAHVAAIHAAALLFTALVALSVTPSWFPLWFVLAVFPIFFGVSMFARARPNAEWLRRPAAQEAAAWLGLAALAAALRVAPELVPGNENLLAACVTFAAICAASLAAGLLSRGAARVRYFRAGVGAIILAFMLACLRAGYDPFEDVEVYTSPIGILALVAGYVYARRDREEYAPDARLLLWAGGVLLCGPLLLRAAQFRLLLDAPALWRDLLVLCVSLVLVLSGALGKLRAPVIVGAITLMLELALLTVTSVHWLQVPLWKYLVTVGVLILIVWGAIENRREQLLALRARLQERREHVLDEFGRWH